MPSIHKTASYKVLRYKALTVEKKQSTSVQQHGSACNAHRSWQEGQNDNIIDFSEECLTMHDGIIDTLVYGAQMI